MRIRTIKPAFFSSPTINRLPVEARLTFVGLWCYVDDEGRAVDDPRLVRAAIWPFEDRSTTKIAQDLERLAAAELICRYQVGQRALFHVVNWSEHQAISKPYKSSVEACSTPEHSVTVPGTFRERSGPRARVVGKGKERNSSRAPDGTFPERPSPNGTGPDPARFKVLDP